MPQLDDSRCLQCHANQPGAKTSAGYRDSDHRDWITDNGITETRITPYQITQRRGLPRKHEELYNLPYAWSLSLLIDSTHLHRPLDQQTPQMEE